MAVDWFYANNEVIKAATSVLHDIHIPIFTDFRHEYAVDSTDLTLIYDNQDYNDSVPKASTSSSNAMSSVVHKVLYHGKIIFAETWNPSNVQDQLAIMLNLSIRRALPSHQFVPILGAGYDNQNNSSKILILKEWHEVRWNDYLNKPLTWSDRLRLALELTNALFYLHSHNLTIRDFSVFIHPDNSVRIDGFYDVNKVPFDNKVDNSRRRMSLVMMQSYNSNIMQYGRLLQLLIQEKSANGDVHIRSECPPRLEALVEWCIDDEPMVLPTALDCLEEIESICKDHSPPVELASPSPYPNIGHHEKVQPQVSHSVIPSAIEHQHITNPFDLFNTTPRLEESHAAGHHQNTATKKNALKHLNDKLSHSHAANVFTDTGTTVAADTVTTTSAAASSLLPTTETAAQIQQPTALLDKKTYALNLLSNANKDLSHIDGTLGEYIEKLQNPFSDLFQQFEDASFLIESAASHSRSRSKRQHQNKASKSNNIDIDEDEDEDIEDLDKSMEGYQYLELITSLYDRLGHIKKLIDQVTKLSFPSNVNEFIDQSIQKQLMDGIQHQFVMHSSSAEGEMNFADDSMELQFQVTHRHIDVHTDEDGHRGGHNGIDSDDEFKVETMSMGMKKPQLSISIQTEQQVTVSKEAQTDKEDKVKTVTMMTMTDEVKPEEKLKTEMEVQTELSHTEIEEMMQIKPTLVARFPPRLPSVDSTCSNRTSSSRRPMVPRLELTPEICGTPDHEIVNISPSFSIDSDDSQPLEAIDHIGRKDQQESIGIAVQTRPPHVGPHGILLIGLEHGLPSNPMNDDSAVPSNSSARPLSKVKETAMAYEMKAKKVASPRSLDPSNKPLSPPGQSSHVASTVAAIESAKQESSRSVHGHGVENELSEHVQDRTLQSIAMDGVGGGRRPSNAAPLSPSTRRKSKIDMAMEGIGGMTFAAEEQKLSWPSNGTIDGEIIPPQLDQPSASSKPGKPIDDKIQLPTPPQPSSSMMQSSQPTMPPLQLKTSNSFILKNFNKPVLERTNRPISVEELVIGDKNYYEDPSSRTLMMSSSPTAPELRRGNSQSDLNNNRLSPSSMPPPQAKGSPTWSSDTQQVPRSSSERAPLSMRSTPSPSFGMGAHPSSSSAAKTVLQDSASIFLENIRKLDSFYNPTDSIEPPSSSEASPPRLDPTSYYSPHHSGNRQSRQPSTINSSRGKELTPPYFNQEYRYSSPPQSYSPPGYGSSSHLNVASADPNPANLNVALSSFLQIVQRCSATSNRAKELIDNMDKKISTSSTSPKRSPGMNPNSQSLSGSMTDWQRSNGLPRNPPHEERARTYSPTTNRTLTSSHFTGRVYSSPERARIAEESRRKAALQAIQSKTSTINMDHKLSHERNAIAYSISPKSSAKHASSGRLDWKQHH